MRGDEGGAGQSCFELPIFTAAAFREHNYSPSLPEPVFRLADGVPVSTATLDGKGAEVFHPVPRPSILPEVFLSHEDGFKRDTGGNDRGVRKMIVIADDKQWALFGQVFLTFYRPCGEEKHQEAYKTTAKVINKVHLLVIILVEER